MDARSLLRAQKATTKIEHPYASYSASGQLRCTICAAPVQKWDAHLLTKQHRTSVARVKAEEDKARQLAAKRKRDAEAEAEAATEVEAAAAKKARIATPEPEPEQAPSSSSIPAGFFSDPNHQTFNTNEDDDDDDVQDVPLPNNTGDAELDDFFASLAAPAPELESSVAAAPTTAAGKRRQRATEDMSAEDIEAQTTYTAAPVRLAGEAGEEEVVKTGRAEKEETEAEKRERLARYDREEIMSRLMEEERAQEDADQRVVALKARMEALKAKRKAAAAAGGANGKASKSKA